MNEIDFVNYANETTPFAAGDSLEGVPEKLHYGSCKLFKWFTDNQMNANEGTVTKYQTLNNF